MSAEPYQLRVDQLPAFHADLVRVLGEGGVDAAVLEEVLARHVVATCAECAIQVSGAELGLLAASGESSPADPRLARLRQGYCGRDGCESYYYRIQFVDHPKIDWTATVATLTNRAAAPPTTLVVHGPGAERRRTLLLGLALVLFLGAAFMAWRFFFGADRIPMVNNEPKYKVDPASLDHQGSTP
jgi:hypothetical protein